MRYKLVMLNYPIIVSEDVIGRYDYNWCPNTDFIFQGWDEHGDDEVLTGSKQKPMKIIAGYVGLPKIDFGMLSDEDINTIGAINISKISKKLYPEIFEDDWDKNEQYREEFEKGLVYFYNNIHKPYSVDDIISFIPIIREQSENGFRYNEDEIRKMLNRPKVFDVEVKIENKSVTLLAIN